MWLTHCSLTSPSHDAAETLSPAFASGGELPLGREIDRFGDRTARDEQAFHLFEVVLQTVVVARQKTRSERYFEHMSLELDPVADLQSPGAVKNLDIGTVAYDLDDLGHHLVSPVYT